MIGHIQTEKHGEGVFGNSYIPVHGHLKTKYVFPFVQVSIS